jgi:hypothetical protein
MPLGFFKVTWTSNGMNQVIRNINASKCFIAYIGVICSASNNLDLVMPWML